MPSQVLVQTQRDEGLPAASTRGIEILESRIDSLTLYRAQTESLALKAKPFDFDVDLKEKGREGDSLRVAYSFRFGKPSSGQICKVSGEAVVRLSRFDSDKSLQYLGDDITNEMAVEIFRRNYESTYLLHQAMAMDAPSPWITQEVSLSQST